MNHLAGRYFNGGNEISIKRPFRYKLLTGNILRLGSVMIDKNTQKNNEYSHSDYNVNISIS